MACVRDCASRKVVCTCPREDQKKDDKKDGWAEPKKPDPYTDPERK